MIDKQKEGFPLGWNNGLSDFAEGFHSSTQEQFSLPKSSKAFQNEQGFMKQAGKYFFQTPLVTTNNHSEALPNPICESRPFHWESLVE